MIGTRRSVINNLDAVNLRLRAEKSAIELRVSLMVLLLLMMLLIVVLIRSRKLRADEDIREERMAHYLQCSWFQGSH